MRHVQRKKRTSFLPMKISAMAERYARLDCRRSISLQATERQKSRAIRTIGVLHLRSVFDHVDRFLLHEPVGESADRHHVRRRRGEATARGSRSLDELDVERLDASDLVRIEALPDILRRHRL